MSNNDVDWRLHVLYTYRMLNLRKWLEKRNNRVRIAELGLHYIDIGLHSKSDEEIVELSEDPRELHGMPHFHLLHPEQDVDYLSPLRETDLSLLLTCLSDDKLRKMIMDLEVQRFRIRTPEEFEAGRQLPIVWLEKSKLHEEDPSYNLFIVSRGGGEVQIGGAVHAP